MRAAGKIALLAVCIVAIALVGFVWRIHRNKARAAKRAALVQQILAKAERGDPVAQAEMGYLYENGRGVPPDYAKALDWYMKSANQDSAEGEQALGSMYYDGRGVPVDHAIAWNWYSKSAIKGNAY